MRKLKEDALDKLSPAQTQCTGGAGLGASRMGCRAGLRITNLPGLGFCLPPLARDTLE